MPLKYVYGKWICNYCGYKGKEALITGLHDYRLLINNKIKNKDFKSFFNIPTEDTKILARLNLPYEGDKKGRVYKIPENF